MAAAASLIPQIHHERQEPGSMLCAQHALNALLQGNYYDPSQLADIAKQLDELERVQVDDTTWHARDRDSLNMDDTGFFSVSVLESALQVWGLRLLRWRSEDMRVHQSKPEEQLAFVLNLDSHWFTIRSFSGGYWFNLNSFLEKPSWVGPSYLGALLGAAESEGYSVFVVQQAEDTRGAFHNSLADECAATLPLASTTDNEESSNASTALNSAAQGLKPSAPGATSSSSTKAPQTGLIGQEDEEADLQAALRASLADADAVAAQEAAAAAAATATMNIGGSEERSSRMHSPTIVGQRRTRGGMLLGDQEMTPADQQEEETDDQVDAIAPSRRRARGLAPSASAAASASSSTRGSPYILPTASGGRRRASRQQSEEGEQASFRRRRQQQNLYRQQREASGGGTSHDDAISIDDDDTSTDVTTQNASQTITGAARTAVPIAIDVDGEESDDDDDFAHIASSAPRSPFLNPALVRSGGSTNSDDDFHSLSSGDDDANLGESWVQGDIDVLRRQTVMQDRAYDDEDAQLQAALAASMRDTGVSTDEPRVEDPPASAPHSFEDDLAAASWINEEDSRAIREAQASFATTMARQASSRSDASPPPPDVERIAKMRAEAKRKAQEEEEARLRGEDTTVAASEAAEAANALKQGLQQIADAAENDEDDSSDDDEPQLSPEEIRRARLARFGA